MQTKEHESNWAQACRAFGFDWPAVMAMNADGASTDRSGRLNDCGSSTSHDTDVIAALRSAQTLVNET
jgi:hypothetical protein